MNGRIERSIGYVIAAMVVIAFASTAHAGVIIYDEFDGLSGANLNGRTPNTTTASATWTANTLFKQNGSYAAGSNSDDRGAYIPIPALVANTQYRLTAEVDALSDFVAFAGLIDTAVDVNARFQTQGYNYLLRWNNLTATASPKIADVQHHDTGGNTFSNADPAGVGAFPDNQLRFDISTASGVASATIAFYHNGTQIGSALTGVDLTSIAYLGIGIEAGSGSALFDSIKWESIEAGGGSDSVPSPAAVPAGLALLVLSSLRRRLGPPGHHRDAASIVRGRRRRKEFAPRA